MHWHRRPDGQTYQDQKAIKKPHHEKKNVLPYLSMGLSTGIDLALWLIGLTLGALNRDSTVKPITTLSVYTGQPKRPTLREKMRKMSILPRRVREVDGSDSGQGT
jgi:hypothetical protein